MSNIITRIEELARRSRHLVHATALGIAIAALTAPGLSSAGGDEHHSKKMSGESGEHASALGTPGDAKAVSRSVEVGMSDAMRFTPATIAVKKGETIRFLVRNDGKLKHEMVLGTTKELKEHAAMMQKMPEMEHADPNMVTVDPGKAGELIWKFTKEGTFDFACLQPGHFEAGMKGKIAVTGMKSTDQPSPDKAAPMSDGEIRKIDKDAGKITIKHGPLANLDMPGMTMVFRVKDPAMLDAVKQGDKVKFTAERAGGALTVTNIETAR